MRFAIASLAVHGAIVGAMAFFLAHDAGHVEGAPGLAGSPTTHFDVTMEYSPPVPPVKESRRDSAADRPPPVAEGLPVDVKRENPRVIEEPPQPEPARAEADAPSAGDSATAPAGLPGQGGTGAEAATRIGDADRTNRLGLYVQKMSRKIQSNIGPAGHLEFPTRALLLLDLRRDGYVTKIKVVQSSGEAALDRLAIRAVEKSNPFDPWERDQQFQLPVVFR